MRVPFTRVVANRGVFKRNKTSFKKGHKKTGGRKKGSKNKRVLIRSIIQNNILKLLNGELKINLSNELWRQIINDLKECGLSNRKKRVRLNVALELLPYLEKKLK